MFTLTSVLLSGAAMLGGVASMESCIAFGQDGLGEIDDCTSLTAAVALPISQAYNGTVDWAVEVPGVGFALCDTTNSAIKVWKGGGDFLDISLGTLSKPSGAVFSDGFLYVACFGDGDLDITSGLAVVNPASGVLVSTHRFPGEMHIHNAYAMDWAGKTEIFVAVLGNPWAKPPVTGRGLVRFDRDAGTFIEDTTAASMNVRSAKQQSDGAIYTLSQEPSSQPSVLTRLVKRGNHLVIEAQTRLPERSGGGGGADVVLGRSRDTVFASDRTSAAGKLYYYTFADREFRLVSSHDTGKNPRYTTVLSNGDVVVCNQDDATLSVFAGLATHPQTPVKPIAIPTVDNVMFFVERSSRQDANGSAEVYV